MRHTGGVAVTDARSGDRVADGVESSDGVIVPLTVEVIVGVIETVEVSVLTAVGVVEIETVAVRVPVCVVVCEAVCVSVAE